MPVLEEVVSKPYFNGGMEVNFADAGLLGGRSGAGGGIWGHVDGVMLGGY